MISGDLTWEICDRSDQTVVATLSERRAGAQVQAARGTPRSASVELSLDDPVADLITEGDKILRVKVAGWTDPLFVGRITQESITYDADNETVQISALDPLQHLARCVFFDTFTFGSGIRSWKNYTQDQAATMRDIVNAAAGNEHGIVVASIPNPPAPATITSTGGGPAWSNPGNAAVADGNPATFLGPGTSQNLNLRNWGFNIPSDATVLGISVDVFRKGSVDFGAAFEVDATVQLSKAGTLVGSNKADGATHWNPNDYLDIFYGGASDLWGTTWTPAEINNSGFGVTVAVADSGGFTPSASIDKIGVAVTWQTALGEIYVSPQIRGFSFPAGSNAQDNLNSVTQLSGAPEYEITPKEATNGDLATMHIYNPRQGSDKRATVICTIGVDEDDNCLALSYEPSLDTLINRYTVIGDTNGSFVANGLIWPSHPAAQASHAASIAQYGVWEASEAVTGLTDLGLLGAHARAMVAANAYPVGAWSVTLDPETGLTFGPDDDFWIGDAIHLTAELPDETLDLDGRVGGATITEDLNGDVEVVINCEPDHAAAGVSINTFTVVVDSQDGEAPPPPEPPPEPETPTPKVKNKTKKKKKKKKH